MNWIDTCDSVVLDFKEYVARFVKKTAKVSPDAYAQMMLQMTFKTMYKWPTQVYEVSRRRPGLMCVLLADADLHQLVLTTDRVEAPVWSRPNRDDARVLARQRAVLQAFDDSKKSASEKLQLLRTSCEAPVKYSREASAGRGVEKHLLGGFCCGGRFLSLGSPSLKQGLVFIEGL